MTARPLFLALTLALAPAAALAEVPVATGDAAEAPMAASAATPGAPPLEPPVNAYDEPMGPDGRMHGEMGIAVGTGGYRSGYLILTAPLGERGQVGIAVSRTENERGRGGYVPGYPMGPATLRETLDPTRGGTCVEVERMDGVAPDQGGEPVCERP